MGIIPIYIYFDLGKQSTQTTNLVAASLLKQIAWPPEKDHSSVKVIYDTIKLEESRPNRETVLKLFIQCAQSRNVRVIFDALDECKDEGLGEIFQLIQMISESQIGVFMTTRPHILGHLQTRFPNARVMEDIKADEEDIHNFLERRIQCNREFIDPRFTDEIIREIGGAQGMYFPFIGL